MKKKQWHINQYDFSGHLRMMRALDIIHDKIAWRKYYFNYTHGKDCVPEDYLLDKKSSV